MGDYNPNRWEAIGDEWVPIRQADYLPDSITERGYTTTIDHGTVVVSGSNAITAVPTAISVNKVILNAVYPLGAEDKSGPIRQVTIPVDGVTTTGGSVIAFTTDFFTPTDDNIAFMGAPNADGQGMGLSFNVAGFQNELQGKRILNVELLYTANGNPADLAFVRVDISRAVGAFPNGNTFAYQQGLEGSPLDVPTSRISSVSFQDVNPFWSNTLQPAQTNEYFPWRYEELANLDASAAVNQKLQVSIFWNTSSESLFPIFIGYAALRVTYCEEQRILYGAYEVLNTANSPGTWRCRLFNTSYQNGATTLPAGSYTVTSTYRTLSNVAIAAAVGEDTTTPPTLGALRQLYEMPSMSGIQINTTEILNAEFTKQSSDVLPHTMIYLNAAVVTGSHAYGNQVAAPVYSGVNVDQDIGIFDGETLYEQIRFYARRYGESALLQVLWEPLSGTDVLFEITPEDFDALPEIVDGWREVQAPNTGGAYFSSAGTVRTLRFTSESPAGGRWEILGANGFTLGGAMAPGNASFAPPNGTTLEMTWKTPNGSAAAADTNGDVSVVLATAGFPINDPDEVRAPFTAVAGGCSIDLERVSDCGLASCVPSAILGNALSWDLGTQYDHFEREQFIGLGNLDSGETWTTIEGAEIFWSVNGTDALFTVTGAGDRGVVVADPGLTPVFVANMEVFARGAGNEMATGDSYLFGIVTRVEDGDNLLMVQVRFKTNGFISLVAFEKLAGVFTQIYSADTTFVYAPFTYFNLSVRSYNNTHTMRLWPDTIDESGAFIGHFTNDNFIFSGISGLVASRFSLNTNDLLEVYVSDFCAQHAAVAGGTLEIQRMDEVDDEWQTIVLTKELCSDPSFCDFEARVGVESTYRARILSPLNFPGPWTDEVTVTLTAPGVSGVGDGNSTLIFTSNQSAAASLAYTMNWEGEPVETFAFPEAGFQDLRTQYGRDFFVAFRPSERGGEQFSRVIVVADSAIPPESLANFKSLRDLAWADLPYICVRDELGNRWFANVAVPSGRVRQNRRIYLAEVVITEVTDTPYPFGG